MLDLKGMHNACWVILNTFCLQKTPQSTFFFKSKIHWYEFLVLLPYVFVSKYLWVQIDFDCSRWSHSVMSRRRESRHLLQLMSQSQRWTRLRVQDQKLPKVNFKKNTVEILDTVEMNKLITWQTTVFVLTLAAIILYFYRANREKWWWQWTKNCSCGE